MQCCTGFKVHTGFGIGSASCSIFPGGKSDYTHGGKSSVVDVVSDMGSSSPKLHQDEPKKLLN